MDEACDQSIPIVYPDKNKNENSYIITRFHEALINKQDCKSICTIPICIDGKTSGALMLESNSETTFDTEMVSICEKIVSLIGPILELKWQNELPLRQKLKLSYNKLSSKLFGPNHLTFKSSVIAILTIIGILLTLHGTFRITANATLEGRIQRVITSPIDGFINSVHARAGDIVKKGQLMGSIDDQDLIVEKTKLNSELNQLKRQTREAMALRNRSSVQIQQAKLKQIKAKLDLVESQLKRTKLVAPFKGIVIEGDLDQLLGAPIKRGEILFKVAPLDLYRIILKVKENDIAHIDIGQSGHLTLASQPNNILPIKIDNIMPISVAENGYNYFRVEAQLLADTAQLRPGMQGIGKINIDKKRLLWIWLRPLIQKVRYLLWSFSL